LILDQTSVKFDLGKRADSTVPTDSLVY